MHNRAFLDITFLSDPNLDHESAFQRFVPFLSEVRRRGTILFISQDWGLGYSNSGCALDPKFQPPIREFRNFLNRVLPALEQSSVPECDARATESATLGIALVTANGYEKNCEGVTTSVCFASDQSSFELFWRKIMASPECDAYLFDRFLHVAFWDLEFGPGARNCWDKTGHVFANIQADLVKQLSYLSDSAIADWERSGFHDGEFARIASVRLSRDEASAGNRHFPDDLGKPHHCRHHSKLTPSGSGKSAAHGGRIYFCIEQRDIVFVGKVSEHE